MTNTNAAPVPLWLALPFAGWLVTIALAPLFVKKWWHRYYRHAALLAGGAMALYYIAVLHDVSKPVETAFDYLSFVSLIAALYAASGGILVRLDAEPSVRNNALLLAFGALLASLIGSIGASVLLIRPLLRINRNRYRPYLVVFFIFIVSNVGGGLTPVGNPPLFMGFLRGVPFEWTFVNIFPAWLVATAVLLLLFVVMDSHNKSVEGLHADYNNRISVHGKRNFIWLALLVGSVFLDPEKLSFVPTWHGHSFVREALQLLIGAAAYKTSDREALYRNRFTFEPMLEVVFLFFAIFFTMMPALQYLEQYVAARADVNLSPTALYWSTGISSSVLDNAPAYLSFLTAAMAHHRLAVINPSDVHAFVGNSATHVEALAISIAAVFFGGMTYIGNVPNLMVKSIVEEEGKPMPEFVGYVVRFALPCLLPVLALVWWLFIR